jgi:hypothetical protein
VKELCLPGETARLRKSLADTLSQQYLGILQRYELDSLAASVDGLSGIFLPSVSESYLRSPRKVMIVGKETRGWAHGLKFMSSFDSAEQYIDFLVQKHQAFLLSQPGNSKFFQFYREAHRSMPNGSTESPTGIIWANLFCLSWHKKSPTKVPAPFFEKIKQISRDLLTAQIEILKPDAIMYVTGPSYDSYLKELFEIKESIVLKKRALWQFQVNGIQAYRTNHPQWEAGRDSRALALEYMLKVNARTVQIIYPERTSSSSSAI